MCANSNSTFCLNLTKVTDKTGRPGKQTSVQTQNSVLIYNQIVQINISIVTMFTAMSHHSTILLSMKGMIDAMKIFF